MLNSNLLRKLDMQDLMVFVAVYDQSSVTEVSETLFVSQSTVSYSLKKLRTSFEDELFINTRAGMRPTYKATSMYGHVQKILESINLCHAGSQAFDPTQKAVAFNICAPEYFEQLILPRLLKTFDHADLPVIVNVHKLETDIPADALRDGRLDLVICFGPHFHRAHKDFKTQMLLEDDLVCVFDKHSAPREPAFSLQSFVERRHVFPTPWSSDTNMIDGWLARQSRKRQVIARANSYSAALKMITGTDFIVTLPRRVQKLLADQTLFGHCDAPNGLPGFTLDMQWNEHSEQDSANTWFREQVVKVCADQGLL
ncbi:DNA-binding transcriptional LysR family regulator [Pseudomonas sp. BIGb0450]|jgi:DNA-binding transcriptional LysR family regulator|uniref:LysR family transcriptional regulator n=1 Tax=Pseudomonas TaxID=286 RepID=UPI0015A06F50|nr:MULTISPECIES: LysR family transcriptional regulator [Pseudomonas]MCS3419619.1 DNA-binding transcriptional LysR family regulator [Pseudomonas sp. BIGb0558]MCS3439187.1 DNA-binding transcriptional LysR family regulator [Pseudomonas sp. BIGb0450]NVZ85249.1 LysR family transcriptional regulator [Pseudomonas yamanorum]